MDKAKVAPPEARILARMYSDVLHWRPTKGEAAEAYWFLRWWCEQNDYNIGELLNSLVPALAYYANNFAVVDSELDCYGKPKISIVLNIGTLEIKRTSGTVGRRPTAKMFHTIKKK